MNIAFAYESVLPHRGGCETYIADISRRLIADRHQVHLYAWRWDEKALPAGLHIHPLPSSPGPRFIKPWRFGTRCLEAMNANGHDVTVGFDKTWGQDVLYPQGGLHVACADHNLRKVVWPWLRPMARLVKNLDIAHWSFTLLERRQYFSKPAPLVVVNSYMVRDHFRQYYGIPPENLHMVRSSIDPNRFPEHDRPKRRQVFRERWKIAPQEIVALFAGMNYRLKGLEPLLRSVGVLLARPEYLQAPAPLRLVIAGNPDFERWQRLAHRLGIGDRVTFVGHSPEMRNAYFASDFLVHPTFYDPCSLVVLEALGCGLPVITTSFNGAKELMTPPREGYVVDDPHDHQQMAWAMGQLMDPDRRWACSLAARKAAAQWTFESHYRQLGEVFQKAISRKQAA